LRAPAGRPTDDCADFSAQANHRARGLARHRRVAGRFTLSCGLAGRVARCLAGGLAGCLARGISRGIASSVTVAGGAESVVRAC
jgi:hypothetical protein